MSSKQQAELASGVTSVDYRDTGYFSPLVIDYLQREPRLQSLYKYTADLNGIAAAIEERKIFPTDRKLLVHALQAQYNGLAVDDNVSVNINSLLDKNTFTITTAHQPNIFTGPLYFVYKILHAIRLTAFLQQEMSAYRFVPVFYMGSEDADLDELGHFTVDGKRYEWNTQQKGAVGRMKIDKPFLKLLDSLEAQICVLPYGRELIRQFRDAYVEGRSMQDATLRIVNQLFGRYGLVVLIPDNPVLKSAFIPVAEKELQEQFSAKAVVTAKNTLQQHYKVQAAGRDINLFYLEDGRRERIEKTGNGFVLHQSNVSMTADEMIAALRAHPERISPNVILRGVFQELVLPNVAFIGGGGELAYWLELKNVFAEAGVHYPVLILRNSFLVSTNAQADRIAELGFNVSELFLPASELLNRFVRSNSAAQLSLSEELGALNSFYQELHQTTASIDPTLAEHVNALHARAAKTIMQLEKKMLRAEKRKFDIQQARILKLKAQLFPDDNLQERVENISGFYGRYGVEWINKIFQASQAFDAQFTVVTV